MDELEAIATEIYNNTDIKELRNYWGTLLEMDSFSLEVGMDFGTMLRKRIAIDQAYGNARWQLSVAEAELSQISTVWDYGESIMSSKSSHRTAMDRKADGKASMGLSKYNIQHSVCEMKVKLLRGVVDILEKRLINLSGVAQMEKMVAGQDPA